MSEAGPGEVVLAGGTIPPEPGIALVAGPIECLLEGIDLRHLRSGSCEIADLVFVAVRDEAWNTIPGVVEGREVIRDGDAFLVTFRVRHRFGGLDFAWSGRIEGRSTGSITYRLDGEAASDFRYNRLGFNILHRATSLAGRPFRTAVDGRAVQVGRFTAELSPQPARDGRLCGMLEPFRQLAIDLGPGPCGSVDFAFEGDDFEIEDQRNFGDATFKTYSTPLQRPAPFAIAAGQPLVQAMTVTYRPPAAGARIASDTGGVVGVRLGPRAGGPVPQIGLGVASDGIPLTAREIDRLRPLRPRHLRVEWDAIADPGAARVAAAAAEARALGAKVEVELVLPRGGAGDHARLAAALGPNADALSVILVRAPSEGPIDRGTPPGVIEAVRRAIAPVARDVRVGASVNVLASLTREPVDAAALGLVGVPVSPTVHRSDDITVMENVEGFGDLVDTASIAMAGRPVRVSPLTLSTLRGPYPGGPGEDGDLPRQVDARQSSLFTAAFTTAALGRLMCSGPESITLFETAGWRGVMERDVAAVHARFHSDAGGVFPVWHVLADLAETAGGWPLRVQVSDPRRVGAWAVSSADATCLVIANLTREPVRVEIGEPSPQVRSTRRLDASTAARAARSPLEYRSASRPAPKAGEPLAPLDAYGTVTLWLDTMHGGTR
jgi:D-apionolactonase